SPLCRIAMWLRPCSSVSLRSARSLLASVETDAAVVAAGGLARMIAASRTAGRRSLRVEDRVVSVMSVEKSVRRFYGPIVNDNYSYLQLDLFDGSATSHSRASCTAFSGADFRPCVRAHTGG